jgi:hypothetical protein
MKEVNTILDLIPVGNENAISRKKLAGIAEFFLLVSHDSKDPDRDTRKLIAKARENNVILTAEDGGDFIPDKNDPKDMQILNRYLKQERRRIHSLFESIKYADKYYTDFLSGRLESADGQNV